MENVKNIFEEIKRNGISSPNKKVNLNISNAKDKLLFCCNQSVENFVWINEYDQIADWLETNNGLGLLLHGNCGVGKTIMGRLIIPNIIFTECKKVVRCYDSIEMNQKPDEVLSKKLISIDDVGTEEISYNYGEKRFVFPELMDQVEKQGKLIIITTNLSADQLRTKYGDRTLDRIIGTTKRVAFNHESFRKQNGFKS